MPDPENIRCDGFVCDLISQCLIDESCGDCKTEYQNGFDCVPRSIVILHALALHESLNAMKSLDCYSAVFVKLSRATQDWLRLWPAGWEGIIKFCIKERHMRLCSPLYYIFACFCLICCLNSSM
jgi:hypothetical protein